MTDLVWRIYMAVLGEEILYGGFMWRVCIEDLYGRIRVAVLYGGIVWWFCMADLYGGFV